MANEIALSDVWTEEAAKVYAYEELVGALSDQLARVEEEYQSLGLELNQFKAFYLDRLEPLFHFNDMLDAAIRAEELRRCPDKHSIPGDEGSYVRANESWSEQYEKVFVASEAVITPDVRAAYREAMKIIHPDLADSDEDRGYRTEMATRINEAYARGDAELIRSLVEDFKLSERTGDFTAKRLALLIKQEFALKKRLEQRKLDLDVLRNSEISSLHNAFEAKFNNEEESFTALADTILNTIASNARKAAVMGLVPDGFKRMKT
ncbi:MAG: hypothetical protein LBS35_13060 [Synergistaceae bacterium]|jgi:hypothetical protein|nr:hypothetical protein [Synergistaceae bacterium]